MTDLSLTLSPLTPADLPAIDKLDDRAFGPGRFALTAYRLREGVNPDPELSFVAHVGTLLVGANRMTAIKAGGAPALLLGPLTVDPPFRSRGIGEALMGKSMEAARACGLQTAYIERPMEFGPRNPKDVSPRAANHLHARDLLDLAQQLGC